jgi:hypothetical protein
VRCRRLKGIGCSEEPPTAPIDVQWVRADCCGLRPARYGKGKLDSGDGYIVVANSP